MPLLHVKRWINLKNDYRADCSLSDEPGRKPEHDGLTTFGKVSAYCSDKPHTKNLYIFLHYILHLQQG